MDWRVIAAGFAALGVLAGGTLLATQVEQDLDAGVKARTDPPFTLPKDAPPLKLNDFKLPKDMPLDLPAGTQVSPDLSKLTLPKDMDIQLPSDLDLSKMDFKLPEDLKLELPPGTRFSPPGLSLPEGATIKLPDGREFRLPPGSDLGLPPEVVERLLAQGLPAGVLDGAREIDLSGLPPDLLATLDPPQFDGPGNLRLPAGTTITLPDGQQVPFEVGALAYAARYLLPAGTTFDIPFDALQSGGGEFPVPQPRSRSQLSDPAAPGKPVAVSTEITNMPARVRKGDPITVSGYVREAGTGRPVAGAPVDVFMNESKRLPGVLVGQGASDATGTFTIRLTLPTDKPARDYQLVNHAVAFTDGTGRAYADGWGDPPFATFASTRLTLDLPARDGLGTPTVLSGILTDNTGAPVSGATVSLYVDGALVARPITSAAGRYSAQYTFPAGTHNVEARFAGTSNYEASTSPAGTIAIDDFAIEVAPVLRAKPGDGLHLTGRVLGKGAAAPERVVVVDGLFGNPSVQLVSDSAGRFSYAFTTSSSQPPGLYTLTYSLPEHLVTKRQTVELNQTGRLTLSAPGQWDAESTTPVRVALASTAGAPIPGQAVRLTLSGPGGSRDTMLRTGSDGSASTDLAPLRPAPGDYTLTARVVDSPHLEVAAISQSVTLGSFEVRWTVPATVVRGEEMSGSATVLFAGRPYRSTSVALDAFGPMQLTTDAAGTLTWKREVPKGAALDTTAITLQAVDHPLRKTTVQVVAIPKLALDAPAAFDPAAPVETSLTLTDDQGAPIRNGAVTLTTVSNDAVQRTVVTTDANGKWRGPLNVSSSGGNVTLSARFERTGSYLAAEGVRAMSASAPIAVDRSPLPWLLPLAAAVAVATGGGAWWFLRKRAKPAAAADPVEAVAPVVARPTDVEMRFGIPDGEPAVWGVGEPLDLALRNRADGGEFDLAWPGGRSSVALGAGAEVKTTLTFPEEGEVTLSAKRKGGDFAPARASVRIVDYRKETAREFDVFLEKARGIEPTLTKQSTPREIAWSLEARLGDAAAHDLEEIALVLEITNYSHYAVSREHYLRFVHAARALDVLFPPAPGG